MLKRVQTVAVVVVLSSLVSCASINSTQDRELKTWQAKNLEVEEKKPALAAALNVLPGIGDFYNGNIGYGVVNLLTWPVSVLWAPVGGADGAKEVNYFATRAYVEELETKKKKLKSDLESAFMTGQMSKNDYYVASKKVEAMELIEFRNTVTMEDIVPKEAFMSERLPSSTK